MSNVRRRRVMRLVTEEVLRTLGASEPNANGVQRAFTNDSTSASSLHTFLTITQQPELLASAGWSPEVVFWSRYFWFRRYVTHRTAIAGPDAGLEQQALQILEAPFPQCEPDWSNFEAVEIAARSI